MSKDFAPLAVEGVDPWDGIEIEPSVRRLAERAADAAGLSVEEWLERAVRRTCAVGLPPAGGIATPGLDEGMTELPDQGEMTLAAAPVGRWAMDMAPEIQPPVAPDASWDPDSVNAAATAATPAAAEPPAKANASWTIIERLAQQQTTRRAPMRVVRKDSEAPAEPPASTLPVATKPLAAAAPGASPFTQATLLAQDTDDGISFDDRSPVDKDLPGMVEQPRVMQMQDPPDASRHATSAGWRQWLLMGVSCLLALTAGMFLAPLIFRTSAPVETSRQVTVDLPQPAPTLPFQPVAEQPVAEQPANERSEPADIPPPPTQTMPAAPTAAPETPPAISPPPPAAEPAKPASPPAPLAAPVPAKAANPGGHGSADSAAPATATAAAPPSADAPSRKMAMAKPPAKSTPPKPDTAQPPKQKASEPDQGSGDPKKLASWLEERVKNGDAASQYRLGVLYVQGQGVPQDYQRAGTLFRAAAEAGVPEAEYNVAVMYNEGMGMPRDLTQAVFWYQKAAAQGNANAAFNLGVAYANGSGVEQNMEEAARWFRRAGSQGVTNAQFNLALLYERGEGVPVSQVEAYAWYAAAATHGDTGAAQRRDHLAGTMAPSELKQAKTRASMLQQSVQDPGKDATATAKP